MTAALRKELLLQWRSRSQFTAVFIFGATSLLLFHIYQVGFSFWDTGYAAALTMVLLAILTATAIFQFVFLDRKVHYQ